MYSGNLSDDIKLIQSSLESLSNEFSEQSQALVNREEKWIKMDKEANEISIKKSDIIRLNVGGDIFATKAETLLKVKDTLFYKIFLSKKFENKKEIFFDRFSTYFGHVLNYLRYDRINLKRFKKQQLEELLIEVEYYEVFKVIYT